jgi:hypothetical protein
MNGDALREIRDDDSPSFPGARALAGITSARRSSTTIVLHRHMETIVRRALGSDGALTSRSGCFENPGPNARTDGVLICRE